MNDRAEGIHRAVLHTRHASTRSRNTPHVAHRPGIDDWLRRQLLAERAWTRRSVLGGLGGLTDGVQYQEPTVSAGASTGGHAAELVVGSA